LDHRCFTDGHANRCSKVRAYDGNHQLALQGGRALAHLLVLLRSAFFPFLNLKKT
jgi:hypothetical protein